MATPKLISKYSSLRVFFRNKSSDQFSSTPFTSYLLRSLRLGTRKGRTFMFSTLIFLYWPLFSSRTTSLLLCPFSFQKRWGLHGHFQLDPVAKSQLFCKSCLPFQLALERQSGFCSPSVGRWGSSTTRLWGWVLSPWGASGVRDPGNHWAE